MVSRSAAFACITLVPFLLILGCRSGERDTVDRESYLKKTGALLEPVTPAVDAWVSLVKEHNARDPSQLTAEEGKDMTEAERTAAALAYQATSDAVVGFRAIVPPQECEEVHVLMMEELQLEEQAVLEMEAALRTGDGDGLRQAYALLTEADEAKQRLRVGMEESDCAP